MKKYDILYLSQILLYSNAKSPYRMSSGKAAFLFYECCTNENSKRRNIKFVWCRTRGYVTANKRTNEIDIGEKNSTWWSASSSLDDGQHLHQARSCQKQSSRIKKNPQRRLTMQFAVDICPISQFMI